MHGAHDSMIALSLHAALQDMCICVLYKRKLFAMKDQFCKGSNGDMDTGLFYHEICNVRARYVQNRLHNT